MQESLTKLVFYILAKPFSWCVVTIDESIQSKPLKYTLGAILSPLAFAYLAFAAMVLLGCLAVDKLMELIK